MKILSLKRMGLLGRKKQINEMTRRTAQEDEPLDTTKLLTPSTNSVDFFERKSVLEYDVERHRATTDQLDGVIRAIKTTGDAAMVSDIVKGWFASKDNLEWHAESRTSQLALQMQANNLNETLFTLLCDRWTHRLKPTREILENLLVHFQTKYETSDAIEDLDDMYRVYAMFIYYDLFPSNQVYERLVRAGIIGECEESVSRSLTTYREMKGLGIIVSQDLQKIVDECLFNTA